MVSSLSPVVVCHSMPEPARSLTKTISAARRVRAQSTGLIGSSFTQSAAQDPALIEQIASVREPHTEGELVAAPSRPAPLAESSSQHSDLTFSQELAWSRHLLRHPSRPSVLATGRSSYLFLSLLQQMREQASEVEASWRSRRRSQRPWMLG